MGVEINKDNSISISGFDKGISNTTLGDFSDMLGVNTDTSGVLSVGYKFNHLTETIAPKNFVIASAGNDYFDLSTPDFTLNNKAVKLTTTGTLPTGLTTTDIYYLKNINSDGLTFRFGTSMASSGYLELTNTGTGTHSFTVLRPEVVMDYTFDSYLNLYLLDNRQRVWFCSASGNYQTFYLLAGNTSSGNGNGIMFYCGYILVWGDAKIDALTEINYLSTSLVWKNDFVSGSVVNQKNYFSLIKGAVPFYSKYDNAIYFGNGNATGTKGVYRIALLEENVGQTFNPETPATFSFVPDVVELPYSSGRGYAQSINESGENIIIGTGSNTIYYWDRRSILPVSVVNMPENNTPNIIVKGGTVYAFNGYNGKFYQITMTDYGQLFEIPSYLFDLDYLADEALDGDRVNIEYTDAAIFLDEILFSIEVNGKAYVMSYNTSKKTLIKKNISSYGETLTDSASVGRIYKIINLSKTNNQKNNILLSTSKRASGSYSYTIEGWQYGTVGNICHQVYDNDEAYVATGLITYGQSYSKLTLKEIQFSLTRALTTGQSIKVYYRRDDNSSWNLLQSISYSVDGSIKDIKKNAPITDILDLQIKIVINGYNHASETGTSPRIKLIRLIP